ncbi:hypothetical protein SAMN05421740_105224 [Parapedobacter koreensis]|uniref:Uncharacterized protein n=1 Tax=Parapedobacter koreensis TaxID=332977 RepID=A0A1H7Q833_9SPHI|nr:hypothetical protein SAMN05421740_105224 [Parapedobacter koreensis]
MIFRTLFRLLLLNQIMIFYINDLAANFLSHITVYWYNAIPASAFIILYIIAILVFLFS